MTRDPGDPPFDVLIVDDEAFVRESIALYLEGEGFRVHGAAGGEEALELAGRVEVEAAVVDIRMPGMDGLTLLSELKRRHPDLEVLMATGFHSLESAVEAMRRGACDYITKPINDLENDLLRFVLRAVERRRLRLRNRELSHGLQRALDELDGARDRNERDATALAAIAELGRRTLGARRREDAVESLGELLPRIAPGADAILYWIEGGRPAAVGVAGSVAGPPPVPPLPPVAGALVEGWLERAAGEGGAKGGTELWFPLPSSGELRGWLMIRARAPRVPAAPGRIALRAIADQIALTLAVLAGNAARSVDAAG